MGPQVEVVDNHVHIPVHKHRHVPMVTSVQRHVDVPVIETIERVVDIPHVKQVDVPQITTIEKFVEVPVQREVHPAEVFHETHVGMPFDADYAGVYGGQQVTYGAPAEMTYGAPPAAAGEQMFDQLDM